MSAPFDSLLFWLLAGVGVVLTGISKSGFAGGAGVLAVPLLALVVPLPVATVVMLPVLLFMDARTIHLYRTNPSTDVLKRIVPAAFVGIAIGGVLMGLLATWVLELITGLVSVLFAAWGYLSASMRRFQQAGWFWGTVSGVTSTLIHAGGPPINVYFLGKEMPKLQWLGTAAVLFGIMNLTKVIPYSLNGFWETRLLLISLLLLPAAWAGVQLGHAVQKRFSADTFTRVCRVLLLVSGTALVVKALLSINAT